MEVLKRAFSSSKHLKDGRRPIPIASELCCEGVPTRIQQEPKIRRACKSYVVEGEQLFYVDKREDGSTFNRLVIRGREEAKRVFMECHLTAGNHRGRDATVGKIKEHYYWPYYYKEVEQKVR